MALQFQAPNLPQPKSKTQALADTLAPTITNLPILYQQLKQQHIASMTAAQQAADEHRKTLAGYGTGAPAPVAEGPATAAGVGPTTPPESTTDLMGRIGTEGVKAQADLIKAQKPEPQTFMFDPVKKVAYDSTGQETNTIPPGSKIMLIPQPKETPEDKNAAKLSAEKPKAVGSLNDALRNYDSLIAEAQAIKDDPSLGYATGITSILGRIPGTGAKRVAARVETLGAKNVIDTITSLKSLSRTGATGFGQLSEREGQYLRDFKSSLDRGLSTKDFQASLDRLINDSQAAKQNLIDTYISTYGGSPSDLGQNSGTNHPAVGGTFNGSKIKKVTPLN